MDYSIVDTPVVKSRYGNLLQALEVNHGKLISVNTHDAHKQRLNLLQWLRRNGAKSSYYTRIIDGKLYLGKVEDTW